MEDNLLQDITIYHKGNNSFTRYNKRASVRNTAYRNRNNTGVSNTDSALIRVFDAEGYGNTWFCSKGDVIVSLNIEDTIIQAPLSELQKKYGKEYVYEVSSIDIFKYDDNDISELNHIKIGGR